MLISGQETDAIFKGDPEGNFIMVNTFASKLTGYTEHELMSMNLKELFSDDELQSKPLRYDLIRKGDSVISRRKITRKDKQVVPVEMTSKKLSDGSLICFMHDLTEKHFLNEALYESENRYKLVIEAAEEGIWDWQIKTPNVYYSDKWKSQLGYLPHELENLFSSWEKLLHPDDKDRMSKEVTDYLKKPDGHFIAEFRLRHKDGSYRWIRNKAISVLNEKGEVQRMVGAHTDITEEVHAKQELIESEKEYRMLFELLPYGGEIIDIEGNILEVSPGTAKMLGYTIDEMIGKHFSSFISQRDLVVFKEQYSRLVSGKFEMGEMNIIKKDGSKLTIIRAGQPILNKKGEVDSILSLSVDISERKKMETELLNKNITIEAQNEEFIRINKELKEAWERAEENENRLMTFINAIPDIVCYKDANGRWLLANKADIELFELQNIDYIGKTNKELAEYTHEVFRDAFENCVSTDKVTWEKGTINKEVEIIYTPSGEKKIFDVVKIPLYYSDGTRKSMAIIGRDITQLLSTQESLIKAKEKAEESNQLKTAFLANMSHEIRTPMNGVLGFSQLLKTPGISQEKMKEYIDIIILSGKHLITIIDDIIEIAKIDAGQIKVLKKVVNVNKVLADLFIFFNSGENVMIKNNVRLVLNAPLNDEDVTIMTDEVRFRQILSNLINNALKFTEKGSVEFGYKKHNGTLDLYIKDTGIGIHPSKHKLIFERFTQANPNTEKLYGGTGLGLAISKAYAQLLGGDILLESEPAKGSTFYFSVPYEKSSESIKKTEIFKSEFIGNNQTVLIVEDDNINIEYIQEILSDLKLNLHFAKTSKEAISFVKSKKTDLILMDIKLPDNNGNYTVKEIRKFNPAIPIIVQSAFAFENEKMESFQAGCNDYIVKPIKKNELVDKMKKYLE
jgi:PAS domain S-box-containing protein